MMQKIAKLIEVKKIIALLITTTMVCLALTDKLSMEQFTPIATIVIGYYFGQSTARNRE